MTLAQIANDNKQLEAWRKKLSRAGIPPCGKHDVPTQEQLAALGIQMSDAGQAASESTQPKVATTKRTAKPVSAVVSATVSAQKTPLSVRPSDVWTRLALWTLAAICASVSVHNMLYIAGQITDSVFAAWAITALFTLGPFLLIIGRVGGAYGWIGAGACVAFEIFCNTVGIYRGLSGLKSSPYEVWSTGSFVESVSRFTNQEAPECARLVSLFMATIVAGLFIISIINLKKK